MTNLDNVSLAEYGVKSDFGTVWEDLLASLRRNKEARE